MPKIQIFIQKTKTQYREQSGNIWSDWTDQNGDVNDSRYDSEVIASPTSGTLTLSFAKRIILETALTSANVFALAFAANVPAKVCEAILIFKIGASLPNIDLTGINWRKSPDWVINSSWTLVFEMISFDGVTTEIWGTAIPNE